VKAGHSALGARLTQQVAARKNRKQLQKISFYGHFTLKFKKMDFRLFLKSWNWPKFSEKIKKNLELNLSFSHDFPKEYFTKQMFSLFRNTGFLLNFCLPSVKDNGIVVTKCVFVHTQLLTFKMLFCMKIHRKEKRNSLKSFE
jgi:hypothetical protein